MDNKAQTYFLDLPRNQYLSYLLYQKKAPYSNMQWNSNHVGSPQNRTDIHPKQIQLQFLRRHVVEIFG